MLLENNQLNAINETYDTFEHKQMQKEDLQEWFKGEDSSFGFKALDINENHLDEVTKMAMLQEKYVNETNFSANVASFTTKLQPLLRRIVPKLMHFDVAGVQPVTTPDSAIYMLKAQYAGTSTNTADATTSVILELAQGDDAQVIAKGDTLTTENGAVGTVVYVESDYSKAVVNVTSGTFVATELLDVGDTYTAGTNDITVVGVYSNEAGFKQILPGYSGPYTTAVGETLGTEMNQMRVTIVKQGISVKSRKLKAQLTVELIKDMMAQHGASAEKEIMFFLETEITNDMNMEIINKYKEIAVNEPNFAISTTSNTQGRWAKEMYSGLYDRILKDKVNLSARNQRGSANILIATAGVISALMSLEKFQDIKGSSGIKTLENFASTYVGTLMDGTKVYQDWFNAGAEYYIVVYKGAGNFDSGVIYSSYTPLEILQATDPDTLQPIIGMMTRYALTTNTLLDSNSTGGSDYCSYRAIDLTSTPING